MTLTKSQLKSMIKNQAILSRFINNDYPDKRFILLSTINTLIDSELNTNPKNSSDQQRDTFRHKLNIATETASAINIGKKHPDLYVDAYTMDLVCACIVARYEHLNLINACINDDRIDIYYHDRP